MIKYHGWIKCFCNTVHVHLVIPTNLLKVICYISCFLKLCPHLITFLLCYVLFEMKLWFTTTKTIVLTWDEYSKALITLVPSFIISHTEHNSSAITMSVLNTKLRPVLKTRLVAEYFWYTVIWIAWWSGKSLSQVFWLPSRD